MKAPSNSVGTIITNRLHLEAGDLGGRLPTHSGGACARCSADPCSERGKVRTDYGWPITAPVVMSSAANSDVVPLRT